MRYSACMVASALVPFAATSAVRTLLPTDAPLVLPSWAPSPRSFPSKRSKVEWDTISPTDEHSASIPDRSALPASFPPQPPSPHPPMLEKNRYILKPVMNVADSKLADGRKVAPVFRASTPDEKKRDGDRQVASAHREEEAVTNKDVGTERQVKAPETPISPLFRTVYEISPVSPPLPDKNHMSPDKIVYEALPISRNASEDHYDTTNDAAEDSTGMFPVNPSSALSRMGEVKATSIPESRAELLSAIQHYRAAMSEEDTEPQLPANSSDTAHTEGNSRSSENSIKLPQGPTVSQPDNSTADAKSRMAASQPVTSAPVPTNGTDVTPSNPTA